MILLTGTVSLFHDLFCLLNDNIRDTVLFYLSIPILQSLYNIFL